MVYTVGSTVPITVVIRDAAGTPTNATSVTLTITLPDGTTVTPAVTNPPATTGTYAVDYVATVAGRHVVSWTSTGPAASLTDVFNVRAQPVALCSLEEVRAHLNKAGTTDDSELRVHIEAATYAVERHRGEVVARRTFTDLVEPNAHGLQLLLGRRPVLQVTTIVADDGSGTTWDPAGWSVDGPAGILNWVSGSAVDRPVRVTYDAGHPNPPENFVLAAAIIAAHLWETQRGQTVIPTPGSFGMETLTPSGMGFAIPSRAVELLGGQPPVFG